MKPISSLFDEHLFLTVGGTETYLQFVQRYPLRNFCAFEILEDDTAFAAFEAGYLHPIVDAALDQGHALLADALVWRASADHVAALGRAAADVARFNRLGVARMRQSLQSRWAARAGAEGCPALVAADVGPRGDGYRSPSAAVAIAAAIDYHEPQIEALARAEVDLLCALTMTNVSEATGIALAARRNGLPVIVSPTLETDGRLPDGTSLGELIERVDEATAGAPLFYMVNCAHPVHVTPVLERARREGQPWLRRFKGLRANASQKSHAELDAATSLDRGEPRDLATRLAELSAAYDLCVLGGCCGTDAEHIAALGRALGAEGRARR